MLTFNSRIAALEVLLPNKLFSQAIETGDYRYIDKLIHKKNIAFNDLMAAAIHANNIHLIETLQKYQKNIELLEAVKNNQAQNEILGIVAQGADLTSALFLACGRKDNATALKFIEKNAIVPAQAKKYSELVKLLKNDPELWQALIKQEDNKIKEIWGYFKTAFSGTKATNDSDSADIGMKIMQALPGELEMEIMEYFTPGYQSAQERSSYVYHIYSHAQAQHLKLKQH